MVHQSTEFRTGWVASIVFHLMLVALFFFVRTTPHLSEAQFVEMTWGVLASGDVLVPESIASLENSAAQQADFAEVNSVELPLRTLTRNDEEIISIPKSKKIISADAPTIVSRENKITSTEEKKNTTTLNSTGAKEIIAGENTTGARNVAAAPYGSSGGGNGSGDRISFQVQWSDGGNRKLLYGEPPSYPAGVNVQAQIKLQLVVLVNGSVKFAQPVQKGNTRLENAALRRVRLWKFEPLQSAQPQVEQTAIVTFNFKLK